jgi:hypothetical protein
MPTDTGTTSVHFGQEDVRTIEYLNWEDIGPSKVLSRSLRDARRLQEAKDLVSDAKDGQLTVPELIDKLEEV